MIPSDIMRSNVTTNLPLVYCLGALGAREFIKVKVVLGKCLILLEQRATQIQWREIWFKFVKMSLKFASTAVHKVTLYPGYWTKKMFKLQCSNVAWTKSVFT